jgi:hydroxyacylglutathione hydrolase
MEIVKLKTGVLGVNTYLVSDNDTEAFVVDPGGDAQKIGQTAAEKGWNIQAVLLTHGHFDHIGALRELQRDGAEVYVHAADAPMLWDAQASLAAQFGYTTEPCRADHLLTGGEELSLCGMNLRVIATPGHTPGGVCYLVGDVIFSGDTLFCGSVGRTDFSAGDHEQLIRSVKNNLLTLPDSLRVLPGHGDETTIEDEKKYNPFVR